MDRDGKIQENRLRRMAKRQGLALVKSRRRDPRAIDYGGYALLDPETNIAVVGYGPTGQPFWELSEIEEWLASTSADEYRVRSLQRARTAG